MSVGYGAVGWNRQKKRYDFFLVLGIALYLGSFIGCGAWLYPDVTAETLMIRAFGSAALILLHLILLIGPAARLDARFLPLLYNRRHMGVTMFLLALIHGSFSVLQFHAFGDMDPLLSLLTANTQWDSVSGFPFQQLGFVALIIFFLMAATSHDFWLVNLTAPVWKALHLGVYVAYGLVLAHVALGVLQAEQSPRLWLPLAFGFVLVASLHVIAGWRERACDREQPEEMGWVKVCPPQDIPNQRAVVVTVSGERVAVFRDDQRIMAVSNVCQHQNGPLGEGRIIDGMITCPWHGYQYLPENGCSPPPFTEKIPTFQVQIREGSIWVKSLPLPAGTAVEPAVWGGES